jgi:anthranilate phosphoribosyltransferase
MLPLMADVLARRGTRAVVFRGQDGLDELTTTGPSTVFQVHDGSATETVLDPATLGFDRATVDDLRGGDADASATIVRTLLAGDTGPRRDVVLLNAGATLEVAGRAASLEEGIALAAEAIDSGAAGAALDRWVAVSGSR